ncbi:MAG: peptidoglycan bridge formation glycyltransferase FemA/FemB family protein [bacterium]|nr:peptidoglycan bridge formation glycyltransferase FemA/FemB family protein [bacterium]
MEIVRSENNYDEFLSARFVSGNFLQSSFWRDFLSAQKKKYWQVAALKENKTIGVCLFYQNELPLDFSYLYAPKGPIISLQLKDEERREVLALILSQARDISIETKKKREIFFKFEPSEANLLTDNFSKIKDTQPKETWLLDLDKDIEELLSLMHAKTRYNIALARKKGVSVRFSNQEKDIEDFLRLIKDTYSRNQITSHSDNYYRLLYSTINKHNVGALALAELDGKIICANLLIRFGEAVTYVHGASDYNYRQFMAPNLLQWETIKQAKELGYRFYDFWGIAPEDGSKPNWQGITRFKKSFGGRSLSYPGSHALIYNKNWYNLYNLNSKIRSLIKK